MKECCYPAGWNTFFVLETLSSCETSLGRLCGIMLLLASNSGFEAFPEDFVEGGGMNFPLCNVLYIMPAFWDRLVDLRPFSD